MKTHQTQNTKISPSANSPSAKSKEEGDAIEESQELTQSELMSVWGGINRQPPQSPPPGNAVWGN